MRHRATQKLAWGHQILTSGFSADTQQTCDGSCEEKELGLNYADLKRQNDAQRWWLIKKNLVDCDSQTSQWCYQKEKHTIASHMNIYEMQKSKIKYQAIESFPILKA